MKSAPTWLELRRRSPRRLAVLLCLVLFLVLQVFASSGALHQAIHPDAASADHHCAITLITGGQLNSPAVLVALLAFVATFLFLQPPLNAAVLSSVDLRLAPGRAPPRF
jgi:hypothetical protein